MPKRHKVHCKLLIAFPSKGCVGKIPGNEVSVREEIMFHKFNFVIYNTV